MLIVTLTESGFSSNINIEENIFKNPNSNTVIKIICKPAIKIDQNQLMDNVCDYINSFIDFEIKTRHVVLDLSTIADSDMNKISELSFQVYW
ncbi:hypothetical protein [Plebeiibacterium marinum]|uniref:Uncharacterized protein n=1 Tax=Plebeiibacterium marinum TaxID=2992111 RepID=A0AAE3MI92_9BACT|nr:hypothetical protein [Plebeiobacterium marinum]MCW3808019.1 hypothetical protein [Plebeiobacterium marinum]